jgi:hypothetical protein
MENPDKSGLPPFPPVKMPLQVVANQRTHPVHSWWRTKFMGIPVQKLFIRVHHLRAKPLSHSLISGEVKIYGGPQQLW